MDYGTGHETLFALFLLCLTLIRFLRPDPDEERQIVFDIFLGFISLHIDLLFSQRVIKDRGLK